jgi:glycosyltransferase involved in cell wall biosynthesis
MPSEHEAFGLVLAESLACGTPVVCTDDGGMPEIVNDPAIGRTFPVGDVDAFAQALDDVIDLARDPLTPARCRESALRWDWQTSVGPKHEALYRRVARRAQ